MSEKYPAGSSSTSGKPVLVSPSSSSHEPPPPSGSYELQPYSQRRLSSPSNQASIVVPVRLDVLLFLLNSAARGAQYALPPVSVPGGQSSPSTCHHGPTAQRVPNCCSCSLACHSVSQPGGTPRYGGDCGGCVRGTESHDNRSGRDGSSYRRDGRSGPAASSAGGWKTSPSPTGWQEKPRGEGRGRGDGDSWRGRQQDLGRSWGDRRHGGGNSASWRSGAQDWRKEGSAFGPNNSNNKRTQEGCLRPPWGAPDAKRPTDGAGVGWLKGQGTKEPARFLDKPAGNGPGKPAVQESGEDWETDYERGQASPAAPGAASCSSLSDVPAGLPEEGGCASAADPPKRSPATSLPEVASQTQPVAPVAAAKPPVATGTDRSKNGGFVSYLQNLFSDLPRKSGSEGSSELVIDTDVESSKPDADQSLKNEMGGGLKPGE